MAKNTNKLSGDLFIGRVKEIDIHFIREREMNHDIQMEGFFFRRISHTVHCLIERRFNPHFI